MRLSIHPKNQHKKRTFATNHTMFFKKINQHILRPSYKLRQIERLRTSHEFRKIERLKRQLHAQIKSYGLSPRWYVVLNNWVSRFDGFAIQLTGKQRYEQTFLLNKTIKLLAQQVFSDNAGLCRALSTEFEGLFWHVHSAHDLRWDSLLESYTSFTIKLRQKKQIFDVLVLDEPHADARLVYDWLIHQYNDHSTPDVYAV